MTGFEYLNRPYPYSRQPFLIASGEKVAFEGRWFSIPAFAALLDQRLFTAAASHPVVSPFKLYINRNSNTTISLEPTLSASGYERGTPHYSNVVTDIRNTLFTAFGRHATDSDHSAQDFLVSHLKRNQLPYNLSASSRPDVIPGDYVHKSPVGLTPSGNELGALYLLDVDMDEIQYQPFSRPNKLSTLNGIPIQPIFPAALPHGNLPSTSTLDDTNLKPLGLGAIASGGMLITGDALLAGTAIKAMAGSGAPFSTEGTFRELIPWALFPAQTQLNRYYVTQNSGTITASGRQALYNPPAGDNDTVALISVADVGTSGYLVQHWPGNYNATSGIDKNGKAHAGLHFVSRLVYNLSELSQNQFAAGRSPINGKKVFGHYAGTEASSRGRTIGGTIKYASNDTIFAYGGVTRPRVNTTTSEFEWATLDNKFSPITWAIFSTTGLGPSAGIFGAADNVIWNVSDINVGSAGVITFKRYQEYGYIDRIVFPDQDRAGDGGLTTAIITYETHSFREGTDAAGNFAWIELPPPQSPTFLNQQISYYTNTYDCGNLMSLFFGVRPNFGFVQANGTIYIQWSDRVSSVNTLPTCDRFTPIGATSTKLYPPTNRHVVGTSAGGSHVILNVTTNNQILVPDTINLSPAGAMVISFAAGIPMTSAAVEQYGPVVWDQQASINYIYFKTRSGRFFFAKMNTSFVITQINEVDATDVILSGRSAVLSI
jgi:hypothetical protein